MFSPNARHGRIGLKIRNFPLFCCKTAILDAIAVLAINVDKVELDTRNNQGGGGLKLFDIPGGDWGMNPPGQS